MPGLLPFQKVALEDPFQSFYATFYYLVLTQRFRVQLLPLLAHFLVCHCSFFPFQLYRLYQDFTVFSLTLYFPAMSLYFIPSSQSSNLIHDFAPLPPTFPIAYLYINNLVCMLSRGNLKNIFIPEPYSLNVSLNKSRIFLPRGIILRTSNVGQRILQCNSLHQL